MKGMNNKGFTLVEVLAIVIIISILGIVAIPSVIKTVDTGKEKSYQILIKNIKTGSQQLFEELSYGGTTLYQYNTDGKNNVLVKDDIQGIESGYQQITYNELKINLQTLVSNGFLNGTNNSGQFESNKNSKVIINPKTKKDIGSCQITIRKVVNNNVGNYKTTYEITNNSSSNDNCPKTDEYK